MKKILLATGIYPPDIGGPATYVSTLREELPKFGFEVKIVTYSDVANSMTSPTEPNVYRIGRQSNIFLRYGRYFWTVFKLCGWADIVYAQGPVSEGLPVWLACLLRGKKYLLKVVSDYAWDQGRQRFGVKEMLDDFNQYQYNWHVRLIQKIESQVARHAYLVITPSEYLKKIVSRWQVNPDKIKVIYNSVEEISLAESKNELRQKFNWQEDIICSVGRLTEWKGFDFLISIMPQLLAINPNFRLFIFGDGPERGQLEKIIEQLHLREKVKLMGSQPQKQLWEYMKASDYFVLNTGYEGLPHLVIEAMQLDLPVVTTRICGNPEVVQNGINGLLVTYNNEEELAAAIINLWRNQSEREKLVAAAKGTAREFNKSKMINGIVETLKSVS